MKKLIALYVYNDGKFKFRLSHSRIEHDVPGKFPRGCKTSLEAFTKWVTKEYPSANCCMDEDDWCELEITDPNEALMFTLKYE